MIDNQDVETYFRVHGTINIDNDIVNVDGFLTLTRVTEKIPFQFGKVTGDFYIDYANLTTLVGCPKTVGGDFNCSDNELTSLVGGPKTVGGSYRCYDNPITSLDGLPDTVGKFFIINWNETIPLLKLVKFNYVDIFNKWSLTEIIQKHCGQKPLRQAIIQCQRELIDAGFKGNAKL